MFVLCAMYVAQGIPWGFMSLTLPTYLADRKLSDEALGGLLAMTTLPYSFKWVWGVVIDAFPSKRFGRRRPWILFAQAMMTLTCGVMIFVPDLTRDIELLTWTIFIHTVFNSMQDVGVDALAVDLLDEEERGRANGFMYASKWIGGIIGGAGLAHVMKWTSLRGALVVQVGLLAAIMTLPLFIRERPAGDEPTRPPVWSAITAWLRRVFGGRRVTTVLGEAARDRALQSALLGIVVMLISVAASVLLSAVNFGLYTRELHWDPGDYTNLQSYALALGAIGSALGGYFADRVGHRRLAGVAALALAAFYVVWSQLSPHWVDRSYVYATFWIEPLCVGTINAALFALCMDIAWPAIAASQFAVYMAMANVGSSFAYAHAGYATSTWDYPTIYLVAAAIQASLVLVLPLIDPRAARHSPRRQRPERRSSSPA